ncbi:MAG: hypothetical protein H7Y17_05875 [Chlorobia bacterium]|nr:hypothetical protein [Fimbriimonadaceae bacterium]
MQILSSNFLDAIVGRRPASRQPEDERKLSSDAHKLRAVQNCVCCERDPGCLLGGLGVFLTGEFDDQDRPGEEQDFPQDKSPRPKLQQPREERITFTHPPTKKQDSADKVKQTYSHQAGG